MNVAQKLRVETGRFLADGFDALPDQPHPGMRSSLTPTPSGLVGQKTSRQGGLSSDVSLQGLVYGRRELRFSFVDAGENLNYRGTLDGDEIDGEVTKSSGAKVGRLKLKLRR